MTHASSTLERTVGLDVSDRHVHACFLGPGGEVHYLLWERPQVDC
jgi:hypothetical protein